MLAPRAPHIAHHCTPRCTIPRHTENVIYNTPHTQSHLILPATKQINISITAHNSTRTFPPSSSPPTILYVCQDQAQSVITTPRRSPSHHRRFVLPPRRCRLILCRFISFFRCLYWSIIFIVVNRQLASV
ncbi:hypothetical protein BDW22DRAFT_116404 [Trametopsis cervina]|nr:hypothetical protein BDW22DRAFT_116404 [Trametopsis cervina]